MSWRTITCSLTIKYSSNNHFSNSKYYDYLSHIYILFLQEKQVNHKTQQEEQIETIEEDI